MEQIPFSQRFGTSKGKLIDNDFPMSARIALGYIFSDLNEKSYLVNDKQVYLELNRIGRFTTTDIGEIESKAFINQFMVRLNKLTWTQVFTFCERAYLKLLVPIEVDYEWVVPIEAVQKYYSQEINQLLHEDNLAFYFNQGLFERRGRFQTQRAIERAGAVLSDPKLERVKSHFIKARKFFDARPQPDLENCLKDALCALEAAVEIMAPNHASKDFEKAITQLQGNRSDQIPAPIAQSMIKLHGYRGSAQGAAHAAIGGNRIAPEDAELVLSLTADFITYLANLYPNEADIPF